MESDAHEELTKGGGVVGIIHAYSDAGLEGSEISPGPGGDRSVRLVLKSVIPPHPLSFPGGGGGGSLGQPKIFRCGSLCCCVGDCVVALPLVSLALMQDILLTFAEMELDSTTIFPPWTNVMFIRSTGEPVLARVVGHSEHGDAYRRITFDRDGKTVLHNRASVRRLSNVPVRWWCGPPGGGGGPSSLGWGTTRGGGGYAVAQKVALNSID